MREPLGIRVAANPEMEGTAEGCQRVAEVAAVAVFAKVGDGQSSDGGRWSVVE
jgi:hypothetical protein